MNATEYIDIHSHVLMGVDDGSKSLDESLAMIKIAYREGIRHIILTPHYKNNGNSVSQEKIKQQIQLLRLNLEKERIPISLYLGNEIYYSSESIKKLEDMEVNTLAGKGRYVLVEFNPLEELVYLRNGLNELICNGYIPILAHVERYECLFEKDYLTVLIKESGILTQINEASIMGRAGYHYKKRTRNMLKDCCVDFVATDAHDVQKRAPLFLNCAKYVYKKYGESYYNKLFFENPTAVLNDKEI